MKHTLLCAIVISVTSTVSFAADDEHPVAEILPVATDEIATYRQVGDWTVYENRTRGSCFITRGGDLGGVVQMGLTRSGEFGYIGIFAKGFEAKEDHTEGVAIVVNDNLYVGEISTATHLVGDLEGGYILADNVALRHDLKKAREMYVFPEQPYELTVDLKKSEAAIFEAQKCASELQGS